MDQITLCLIVKNEAPVLEETVASCRDDFDQLVIVDTGSDDGTQEIAEKLGASVYHFDWINDFSAARNFAVSCCDTPWVFMIDADEELPPECRGLVRKAIEEADPDVSAIYPLLDCGSISHYCDKIFRKGRGHWQNPSHNVYVIDEGRGLRAPHLTLIHDRKRRGDERQQDRDHQRNTMNEANFRKQVKDDPKNQRAVWYLAMTLAEAGKLKESVTWWKKFLKIGDWPEERYEARLELADVLIRLGKTDEAIDHLIMAYKDEPRRAEAAMTLGDMYSNGNAYLRAEFWYKAAAGMKDPVETGCQLFMQPRCYGAYPWLRLAALYQTLDRTAEHDSAIGTAKVAVRNDDEMNAVRAAIGENINTPEYWDGIYGRGRDVGEAHRDLFNHVAEIIADNVGDGDIALLDVGAGTGELLDYFEGEGRVGIDFSTEASKHPCIVTDDAQNMVTQAAGSYDVVTCLSTLEHVDDAGAVLSEIRRVANAGALIVISVPALGMVCDEHVRQYTAATLADDLKRHFTDVEVTTYSAWLVATCIRPKDGIPGPVGTPGTPGLPGIYDRDYFENNPHYGGEYDLHLYPEFERRADEALHWFPQTETSLDIGCAKGFLVKALCERGILSCGMDASQYAIDNADPDVASHLFLYDVTTELGWADESYDLVTAYDLLEHIPADKVPFVVEEMKRVARLGIMAYIDLTDCDPTHLTVETADYWKNLFGEGTRVDPVSAHGTEKIRLIWTKRRSLDIYCGSAYADWSPETTNRGSWKAVAKLAYELQSKHGWEVRVYAQPPGARRYDGVQYLPYTDFSPTQHRDVIIASRRPEVLKQPMFAYAKLYRHDDINEGVASYLNYPHIFVSQWQAGIYDAKYHIPNDLIRVTRNGVSLDELPTRAYSAPQNQLLFAAQPQRGLGVMLDIWEKYLRPQLPFGKLVVCGSFNTWKQESPDDPECYRVSTRALGMPDVELRGMVPEDELFRLMQESRALVYPSIYPETSCMVAIEAAANGLPVVCRDLGALKETIGNAGIAVSGDPTSDQWQRVFADEVLSICRDDAKHLQLSTAGKQRSQHYDWSVIATEWNDYLTEQLRSKA